MQAGLNVNDLNLDLNNIHDVKEIPQQVLYAGGAALGTCIGDAVAGDDELIRTCYPGYGRCYCKIRFEEESVTCTLRSPGYSEVACHARRFKGTCNAIV